MSNAALDAIAGMLRPGVSELMVHPGLSNEDFPFCNGYEWRRDLAAVTHYSREKFEARFAVRLVSYGEAWSSPG